MRWIVLKFGGTSVSRRHRWENIGALMRARRQEGARVLTVVSALSGVTDALKALIALHGDPAAMTAAAEALIERHLEFARELDVAPEVLNERVAELRRLVGDVRAAAGGHAWQAELQAQGELWSSTLGAHFLASLGLPVQWLDARDFLTSREQPLQTEWARYQSAICEPRPSAAVREELTGRGALFLTQGFIARHPGGDSVILGRGGSDTSASYFGALLGAERVEIWTDVPGMFSANPKQVPDARLLRRLDYDEAQEIATTGAKVLHPRAIGPVREVRVPLWIKDTERPELAGTQIAGEAAGGAPSVKAISMRSGITLVSMESIGMWQQVGFLADVFACFKQHGLSVDLIGSAETNVTVSLDPSDNLLDAGTLDALCRDLARVCRVRVIAPCAAVTLVGRGMRGMMHRLSEILAEIGARRVHLVSQSSNNLNLTFVIDAADADGVVPALHAHLVRAGLTGADGDPVFGPSWREIVAPRAAPPPAWWESQRPALRTLAEAATPVYVYAASVVRERASDLRALRAVDRRWYALKANPHAGVLRALAAQGFGMECVSQGELEHVRAVLPELPAERILFTPNFAARREYAAAFALGARVTIDNLTILQRWGELLAGREILLRLDLGRGLGHHDKVRTGGERSKFGIGLSDLDAALAASAACGAEVVGLHAHLGSGILDVAHWKAVYAELAALAERIPSVRVLDIGGGLGVPHERGETPLAMAELDAALAEVKAMYPRFELWIEPGRYLVAESGVLLARVTQVKHKAGVNFVGVDAGMHTLLRPALYEAFHEIANLSRIDAPAEGRWQVVGPICESGDVLGRDRALPAPQEDEILLVAHAGAYGAAMASRYNLREAVREVWADEL
ncbi:MAG: bifunctional aspartate kinase/diaminopimelate decarboxylase [Xanthomonadales bacterium PRO6]|nr:Diaminopimelate decarboxylase [Xanthomonadales bacterium]MCE7930798.1 bifunctional aspartate kinase/diaminopimelate decarboxylase [Xanthomonadales bacterium PRO6]